jgi:uncharacterized protein with PQ loop repeat
MTMPFPHGNTAAAGPPPASGLERLLRIFSIITMVLTVPQVVTVWADGNAGGVSVISWSAYLVSACLWLVYGLQKRDRTIYLPCIGWILLDAAVVAGAIVNG